MSTNEVLSNPNASAAWSPNQRKFANLRKFTSEPVPEVYGGDNRRIISYTHAYTKAYGKDSRLKGTGNGLVKERNYAKKSGAFFLDSPAHVVPCGLISKVRQPCTRAGEKPASVEGDKQGLPPA